MTDTTPDETLTPEVFDFDEWLATSTVARRQVMIYNDPALLEESEALQAQLAAAETAAAADAGDQAMDAIDPRPGILARMEELYERWEASKTTWTVRALAEDEVEDSFEPDKGGIAVPRQPVPPLEKAGQKARDDYTRKYVEWSKANTRAQRERRLVLIAAAVTKIEAPGRVLEREAGAPPVVTVDQLRALRERPHGEQWVAKLYHAVDEATHGDREVPRPTLPGRSTSDLG
ncbi:hypothetical protein OEB99_16520 [Actinotalea sp. M2MS4P-6]|uniref:hypothetical protein n=1 Tax=Actinotalea sp. M2MS4P-6 TaxID=2983762 RepID=UPI0021E3D746|nr:hypothetical protein [Actinotalea sp. M2MS4P-6]MCV2395921.1 hypothetical protein [Actinotalea sp. M2MS4P-6]